MRLASGLAVPGAEEAAPAAAAAEAEEEAEEVAEAESTADPMAEVPPELLAKPFEVDRRKIIVAQAPAGHAFAVRPGRGRG